MYIMYNILLYYYIMYNIYIYIYINLFILYLFLPNTDISKY